MRIFLATACVFSMIPWGITAAETPLNYDTSFDKALRYPGFAVNKGLSKKAVWKKVQDEKTGACLEVITPADATAEIFGPKIPVQKEKDTLKFSVHVKGKGIFQIVFYEYRKDNRYLHYTPSKKYSKISVNSQEWIKKEFEIPLTGLKDQCAFIALAFHIKKDSNIRFDDFTGSIITN